MHRIYIIQPVFFIQYNILLQHLNNTKFSALSIYIHTSVHTFYFSHYNTQHSVFHSVCTSASICIVQLHFSSCLLCTCIISNYNSNLKTNKFKFAKIKFVCVSDTWVIVIIFDCAISVHISNFIRDR